LPGKVEEGRGNGGDGGKTGNKQKITCSTLVNFSVLPFVLYIASCCLFAAGKGGRRSCECYGGGGETYGGKGGGKTYGGKKGLNVNSAS
nr:hypothetical protein [Tanacetum cinerariifolium]